MSILSPINFLPKHRLMDVMCLHEHKETPQLVKIEDEQSFGNGELPSFIKDNSDNCNINGG